LADDWADSNGQRNASMSREDSRLTEEVADAAASDGGTKAAGLAAEGPRADGAGDRPAGVVWAGRDGAGA